MDLATCDYDQELLDFFGLDRTKIHLPQIVRSSDKHAYGSFTSGPLAGIPITGCLGDQSAALVGQKGFAAGSAKNTYGTGCFLLYNVGDKPVISKHGLLATVAYYFDDKPVYALEGSIAVAGSGIKFLMNNLGLINSSAEINDLAASVEDNGGCIFVTAFSGLFAPYWIDDCRGTIRKYMFSSLTTLLHSKEHGYTMNKKLTEPSSFPSRHHTVHQKRSPGPRNPRSNMLPNQSNHGGHGAGLRPSSLSPRRRRRHVEQRPHNADASRLDSGAR